MTETGAEVLCIVQVVGLRVCRRGRRGGVGGGFGRLLWVVRGVDGDECAVGGCATGVGSSGWF